MSLNMKQKIIIIVIFFTTLSIAQQIYHTVTRELTPGVEGNQIVLQLSNISQRQSAENVEVKMIRQSANLKFATTEVKINNLNKSEEKEASFIFDVNYNVDVTKKDTIEFLITDNRTIHLTKQFIFTYTQPKEFKLEQNYPNPFNPTTKSRYSIPASPKSSPKERTLNEVRLKVYDILGNEIVTLVNEQKEPGYYEVEFNASSPASGGQAIASGVYIYRLTCGRFVATKKMLLLR